MDAKIIKLQDQIWITRVSRINAERRLIWKSIIVQVINIYYSCAVVFFAILSLIRHDDNLSLISIFISIALLVAILYLTSLRYSENAREYRKNYTSIQRLEFELNHIKSSEDKKIQEIENRFCILLDSSSNHSSFDYTWALLCCNKEYRERHKDKSWRAIRFKFYFGVFWRVLIIFVTLIFPIAVYCISEVMGCRLI